MSSAVTSAMKVWTARTTRVHRYGDLRLLQGLQLDDGVHRAYAGVHLS